MSNNKLGRTLGILLLTATLAGCKKDADAPTTTTAAKAVEVAITPTGEAQVTLKDSKGETVAAKDVTGKVELADGQAVPLTPGDDGKTLKAPLGSHMGDAQRCMANVRVKTGDGSELTKQIDLCREHARHGGQMGTGHGPMGGGPMGHGDGSAHE